jgi:hypothetical protein
VRYEVGNIAGEEFINTSRMSLYWNMYKVGNIVGKELIINNIK